MRWDLDLQDRGRLRVIAHARVQVQGELLMRLRHIGPGLVVNEVPVELEHLRGHEDHLGSGSFYVS